MSFIDDLGFLIGACSISKVGKLLEKEGEIALEWGANNLVTYDMSKPEATLFSQARHQKLVKQLSEMQVRFGRKTISLNKEATRWLGIWLDSHLNFAAHFNERMRKAKAAEFRIMASISSEDKICCPENCSFVRSRAMVERLETLSK